MNVYLREPAAGTATEMSTRKESREEIKDLLRNVRNEVQKFSKDLATATQKAVDSTEQAARRVSPRITETLDTILKDASTSFRRVMGQVDSQTKNQQVKVLRTYKQILEKQADAIEKRLRKLTG